MAMLADSPDVPNPHDALVKATFSRAQHAADLFRFVLPAELVARLDFATLTHCPGSFVNEALGERFTDLLYSIELDGCPMYLYLLLEHLSQVDRMVPLRLWRYQGDIWQYHLDNHAGAGKLPPILSLVLHHSAAGWTGPRSLRDILHLPPDTTLLDPHLPALSILVEDLTARDDRELYLSAMAALPKLALWSLKHGRASGLLAAMRAWTDVMLDVFRAPNGVAALSMIVRYILQVNEVEPDELERFLITEVHPQTREAYMTGAEILAQRALEKGIEKGIEQGREQALRGVLSALLDERFGTLSESARQRIDSAAADTLEQWTRRVFRANSLDDIFAGS